MVNGKERFVERVIGIAKGLGHYWATSGQEMYQEVQNLLQESPPEDPDRRAWLEAYAERVRNLLPEAMEYIQRTPFEEAVLDPKGHRVLEALHNATDEDRIAGIPHPLIQEGLNTITYEHETGGRRFRFHVEAERDLEYDTWNVRGWIAVQSPKGVALALEWEEDPWGGVKGKVIPGNDLRTSAGRLRFAEGIHPGARHYDALLTLLEEDLARKDPVFEKLLKDFQEELKDGIRKDLSGFWLKLAAGNLAHEASEASQKAKLLEEFFRDYASAMRREDSYSLLARYATRVAGELQQASQMLAAVGKGLDQRVPELLYPKRDSEVPVLRRVLDLYREAAGISGGDGVDRGMRDHLALALEPHILHLTQNAKNIEGGVAELLAALKDHQASLRLYVRETLSFPPNTESDPDAYWREEERRKALREKVLSEKRAYVRDDSFFPEEFFYSKRDRIETALASLDGAHTALEDLKVAVSYRSKEIRVGVNGNLHEYFTHPVQHLEYGGVVAYGSFSGQTGYSGHWDELRLGYDYEAGKYVLLAKVNETDTSHRDPSIILEEPIGDWGDFREKLVRVGDIQKAYETLYELARPFLRELHDTASAVTLGDGDAEDRSPGDCDLG